jgi:hypothetical protein
MPVMSFCLPYLFFLLPFASFSGSLSVFLSNPFSATQFTFPSIFFSNAFLSASFSTSFLAYLSAFLSFSVFSFYCSIQFSVYCLFASHSVFLCTSCSAFLFVFLPASFLLLLKLHIFFCLFAFQLILSF